MPYSGTSDDNLPEAVKKLPAKDKRQWVAVFNSAYKKATEEGKNAKEAEQSAFAQAWGVLKKQASILSSTVSTLANFIQDAIEYLTRSIKSVDTWDGSASRFDTTEAYCNACLINVNSGDPQNWKQDHCMLPVREPGDGKGTFVDKAVQAAAGGHGITQVKKPSDVPQNTWAAAVKSAAKKIKAAYAMMKQDCPASVDEMTRANIAERALNTMDIFMGLSEQAQAVDQYAWITDLYYEENGQMFAIIAKEGKLYRADVHFADKPTLDSEWTEVQVAFKPAVETQLGAAPQAEENSSDYGEINLELSRHSRFLVRQLPDGRWRWISVSCSAVLNRVGEIDSRALFDSFVEYTQATGEYPIRMFYHSGEAFRTGQCDFVGREGYLLITSGLYDKSEIANREIKARLAEPEYWGESIGFAAVETEYLELSDGVSIPINNRGRLVEISTCPEDEAAAWLTATDQVQKEVSRMEQRQFDAFKKLFADEPDPEAAAKKWLEEHAAEKNRAIEDTGMVTRSVEETAKQEEAVPEQVAETLPELEKSAVLPEAGKPEDDKAEPTGVPRLVLDDDAFSALAGKVFEQLGSILKVEVDKALAGVAVRLDAAEQKLGQVAEAGRSLQTALDERLQALELDEAKKRDIWLADAPGKSAMTVSYRPRADVEQVRAKTSEDVARETLSKFPMSY